MLKSVLRWTFILTCLLVLGPIVYRATGALRDIDGGAATTLLINASPAKGLIIGGVCFVAAAIVGAVGAWFFSLGTGSACAGIILCWAAWGLGTIEDVVRRAGSSKDFTKLGIEGLAVMIVTAMLLIGFMIIARKRQPAADQRHMPSGAVALGAFSLDDNAQPIPAFGAAMIGAIVAAVLATMLIAVTFSRGQTLAACLTGAIAAGLVAQFIASGFKVTLTPLVPAIAVALLAAAGPFVAQQMFGAQLTAAVYKNDFVGIARPISLDWAAGALLGVPVGIAWAGAVLDKRSLEIGE